MATGSPTSNLGGGIETQHDVDSSVAGRLRAIVIIFEILSLLAVALRFVARKLSRQLYSWDDWLAIVAAIISLVNMVNDIVIIGLGAGQHLATIDPDNMVGFLKSVFVGQVIYAPVIVAIKLSILFLYLRLFNPNTRFCRMVYVLIALTVMWGIAVTLTTVLQCLPVSAVWDPKLMANAQCINLAAFMAGSNIPDILLDIAILVLPAPMIWKLKVPTSKKIAILSIFLLAAFDLIMAVTRLASLATFNKDDPTWGFTAPMIWSTVEINVGLICACLPVMTPIFQKLFGKWLHSWSTRGSTGRSGGKGNANGTRRAVTVNDIGTPTQFRRLGDAEDGMSMMVKGTFEMARPVLDVAPAPAPRPPPPPPKDSLDWPPVQNVQNAPRPVMVIRPKSGVPF